MADALQHEMMPLFRRGEVTPPPSERVLEPEEQIQVDLDTPLAGSGEMHKKLGIRADLIAVVNASSMSFLIVDTRQAHTNSDFLIADETFSKTHGTGFKGVSQDESVIIGRDHYADRFSYPATVSHKHFEVIYTNRGLFIRNLRPTNKTTVIANLAYEQQYEQPAYRHAVDDMRTIRAEDRMQTHPNFGEKDETAPYGYYMNHPILGRASRSVEGGVYLGGSAREAIVVDGRSMLMKQVYQDVASELRQSFKRNETLPTRAILLKAMHKVQEVMPYDEQRTEDISQQHYGDKLVGLSTFVKERAGVCRHQGLFAAYIIENLIKDGHMQGTVGVERNTVENMGGTHAWAVYKTRSLGTGGVIVVDPAQSFAGTKAEARHEGRWEYRLTTDEY